MNLLKTIGLMRRAEHEAWLDTAGKSLVNSERDLKDMTAKFKRAATDLAAQAEEIAALRADCDLKDRVIGDLNEMIENLRPDAEAMRRKRAADRKRMAGKRGKNNG